MATSDERLLQAIRQMADFSVVDDVMPAMLHRIALLANETLAGSAMVGLTMEVRGRAGTPVFTDESAPEIDAAQYATGVGPCLDSFRDGVVHGVPSTSDDRRWRPFSAACLDHGIHSTLSVPVISRQKTLGALNFYSTAEAAFGADDEMLGTAFAAQAAIVIANGRAYWDTKALAEQLTQALETRVVIEQAKGILMASGSSSAGAFDTLRRMSQRENRKLHAVAADLVGAAERRATTP